MSRFFENLEQIVKNAEGELKEFAVKFKEDPAYALRWADGTFQNAVRVQLGKTVLSWNREASQTQLQEQMLRELKGKTLSMNRSTSPSANLITDMEIEFWAFLMDSISWYPHSAKEGASK